MNDLFQTEDEAKAQGVDVYEGLPFIIERVRPARMSDFLQFNRLWGDMREAMQERVGDDSLMDDSSKLMLTLELRLLETLDSVAADLKLPLDNLTIVESRRVVLPQLG